MKNLFAAYQLLLCSFAGGIVLSVMELANMFKQHQVPDIYFFGGIAIAGFIGIIGHLMTGAPTVRTAFASGISAPQLLGGLVKAGAATASITSSSLMPPIYVAQLFGGFLKTAVASITLILCPPAYAGTHHAKVDSIKVVAILQGVDSAEIMVKGNTYKITTVTKLTVPRDDSITVGVGNEFYKTLVLGKRVKDIVLKLTVVEEEVPQKMQEQTAFRNVMRGMFAQEQKAAEKPVKPNRKFEVTIE